MSDSLRFDANGDVRDANGVVVAIAAI